MKALLCSGVATLAATLLGRRVFEVIDPDNAERLETQALHLILEAATDNREHRFESVDGLRNYVTATS